MNYHLSLKSENAKTGPIPVSTTSADSCPDHCPLKDNGCYAAGGPLGIHWKQVTRGKRGTSLEEFCESIASLPEGQLWRHNQAGDLPGRNDKLDAVAVRKLVRANRGKRGFTYTHYPPVGRNVKVVRDANRNGFTVNLSADNIQEADRFKALDIAPVVVVVDSGVTENFTTPEGNKVVVCPATQRKNVSCATCKLCAWGKRDAIIAFPAHGASKRKAELVTISI